MTIGAQVKEYLDSLDDGNTSCYNLFIDLRKQMFIRNWIHPNVVDWYKMGLLFVALLFVTVPIYTSCLCPYFSLSPPHLLFGFIQFLNSNFYTLSTYQMTL